MGTKILTFTVVAAVVTTSGSLLGHVLKEVVFARWFDQWKRRHESQAVYRRYRDPIVLASKELARRLAEAVAERPAEFLARVPADTPVAVPSTRSVRDSYYHRYKQDSTVYRLAAFLGWLELYRLEIVFLDAGSEHASSAVRDKLDEIRALLADGTLLDMDDWQIWRDALIFREEQRGIGEAMITGEKGARSVLGYGAFLQAVGDRSHAMSRWVPTLENFLLDPQSELDFRAERFRRLVHHLVELVHLIHPETPADPLQLGEDVESVLTMSRVEVLRPTT